MEAAMAAAQEMANARSQGLKPGESASGNDGVPDHNAPRVPLEEQPVQFDPENLPDLKTMGLDDWAKLPPKVAAELLESQRENLSPEFRQQINHYFRIIGERARSRDPKTPGKP